MSIGEPRCGNTRVVVADHHPDYLDLLVLLVDGMPTLDVVGRTLDGADAVRLALETGADIALLEVLMPSLDGFGAADAICSSRPQTTVLLHTRELREGVQARARELGLFVFEKLELVKSLELLERLAHARPPLADAQLAQDS
jgi:DNA-binding NarL/FixJ family response regulator